MVTSAPIAALRALDGIVVAGADAVACRGWLGDVRRVRGFLDAVEAQVLRRVEELAVAGESYGAADTSVRCSGVSSRQAAKLAERAKTLEAADGFDEALAAGTVTGAHVDQLAAAANALPDEVRESLFERSAELLEHAAGNDPARFGRHVRDVARGLADRAGISRDRQQRASTRWSWKVAADGMYDVHARLHPILGDRLVRAIDAAVAARVAAGEAAGEPEFVNRTVDRSRLAAEALVDMVSAEQHIERPLVADISVLVDAHTLECGEVHDHTVCETEHGAPVAPAVVLALLCSGLVTPVVRDANGTVLDLGRTTRRPSRAQRRALRAMYRTCAAHGCEVPFVRCEIHHIIHWLLGGHTDLDNLIPLCSRHHHLVHTLRWHLDLAPDRTLTITDPDGRTVMVTTPDMPTPAPPQRRRTQPATAGTPTSTRQLAS